MYLTRIALCALVALAAVAPTACRRNSEALASFKGGEVTRGDLRMVFRLRAGDDAEKAATIQEQDKTLQQLALIKIAAAEAKAEGLDKLPETVRASLFVDKRAALEAFHVYVRLNSEDHEFEFMEVQHLILRSAAPETKGGPAGAKMAPQLTVSRHAEAEALLKQLNSAGSDEAVHKLIREKTDLERYKPVAGYEVPICVSCGMNPQKDVTDRLKAAKEGEFIHVPGPGMHTLIRKIRTKKVTTADLEDYLRKGFEQRARLAIKYLANVKDEKERKTAEQQTPLHEKQIAAQAKEHANFLKREIPRLSRSHIMKAREQRKFQLHPEGRFDPKTKYTDETKLFSIDGVNKTYGDLKKELPGEFTDEERMQRAGVWLDSMIMEKDPLFQKSMKSNIYSFFLEIFRNNTLAEAYFKKHVPEVKPTEQQVRAFFETHKEQAFKGRAYGAARADVERQLINQQRQQGALQLRDRLTKKYDLRVFRDKLEANKL